MWLRTFCFLVCLANQIALSDGMSSVGYHTYFPPVFESEITTPCESQHQTWPLGKYLSAPFDKNAPDYGQGGPTVYFDVWKVENEETPPFASVKLTPEFIHRLREMAQVCRDYDLSECAVESQITWAGEDLSASSFYDEKLVVYKGCFKSKIYTDQFSATIETSAMNLIDMEVLLSSKEKEYWVSDSDQDLSALKQKVHAFMHPEQAASPDSPAP